MQADPVDQVGKHLSILASDDGGEQSALIAKIASAQSMEAHEAVRRRLDEQFADSLTSREILRSTRLPSEGREPLREIIARVERTYFGEYAAGPQDYMACREQFVRRISRNFLALARTRQQTIICVSNEVGLGVVPNTNLGRVFRDLLGRVNQEFAVAADEAYLLIAGLPLQLKPTS